MVSIGITLNPSARNNFFLIVPEIARLTEEAKNIAGLTRQKKKSKGTSKSKHSCIGTRRKKREEANTHNRTIHQPVHVAIAQHEFSVVPRSLFANDGTMFHCSMKSALISILEKTGESLDTSRTDGSAASSAPSTVTVASVDGMAEL